jgi:hypothetical protein
VDSQWWCHGRVGRSLGGGGGRDSVGKCGGGAGAGEGRTMAQEVQQGRGARRRRRCCREGRAAAQEVQQGRDARPRRRLSRGGAHDGAREAAGAGRAAELEVDPRRSVRRRWRWIRKVGGGARLRSRTRRVGGQRDSTGRRWGRNWAGIAAGSSAMKKLGIQG